MSRDETAAYLLGELDANGRARFEQRLAADPRLRDEVERLAPVVRELVELPREGWEAEEMPPLELPVGELPGPPPARSAGWRSWLTPRRIALAGAVSAAVFVGGIVLGSRLGEDNPEGTPVTVSVELSPLAGSPGSGTGTVELAAAGRGRARVVVDGLPATEPGTYYELWLLDEGETVSLGSFTVDAAGHADSAIWIPVDPDGYDAFDISVEREDGDPSHSGDSVLRGPTTPA